MDAQVTNVDPVLAELPSTAHVVMVPLRICATCNQRKQANEENFAVVERKPFNVTVYDLTCKVCRDLQDQQRDLKAKPGALFRMMEALSKGKLPGADDALKHWYNEFGGAKGAAREAKKVYDAAFAKADYKVAARILDMGMRLQMKVSTLQQQVAMHTVENLDREELDEYIASLESRLEQKLIEMAASDSGAFVPEVDNG